MPAIFISYFRVDQNCFAKEAENEPLTRLQDGCLLCKYEEYISLICDKNVTT